mmetsp:Transcript_12657/g.40433  ORF Transcript_12657/g.40433 Transcript_12657/m.40433 type:complete len:353 (-) Transcript_12657:165-1223(-)
MNRRSFPSGTNLLRSVLPSRRWRVRAHHTAGRSVDAIAVLAPDADAVSDAHAALCSLPGCSSVWNRQRVSDGMESACVSVGGVAVELASSATVQRAFRTVGRPAEARLLAVGSCGLLDTVSSLAVEGLCGPGGALSGWIPSLPGSMLSALDHPRIVFRDQDPGLLASTEGADAHAARSRHDGGAPAPWFIKELALGLQVDALAPASRLVRSLSAFDESPAPNVMCLAHGPRIRLLPSTFSSIVLGVPLVDEAVDALEATQCGAHVVGYVGASGVRKGQPQLALPGLPCLDVRLCDQIHVDPFFCESPAAAMQNVLPELHREQTEAMSCRGVNLLEMYAAAKAYVQGKLSFRS